MCRSCLRGVAWFSYWFDNLGLISKGNTYRRCVASSLPLWGNTGVVQAAIKRNFWRHCRGGVVSRQLANFWRRYPKRIDNPFNTSGCEYLLFVCRCHSRIVAWFSYWFDNLGLITEGNTYRSCAASSLSLWGNTDVVQVASASTIYPQLLPSIWTSLSASCTLPWT